MILDQQLCFALYRASRTLIRTYDPLLKPLGLTYPQYLVMLLLWEQDDRSVKELGEHLSLDSATLTPLLKRLATDKIVERSRDEADERVVRISLTKKGMQLRPKTKAFVRQLTCRWGFDIDKPASVQRLLALRDELNQLTLGIERNTQSVARSGSGRRSSRA